MRTLRGAGAVLTLLVLCGCSGGAPDGPATPPATDAPSGSTPGPGPASPSPSGSTGDPAQQIIGPVPIGTVARTPDGVSLQLITITAAAPDKVSFVLRLTNHSASTVFADAGQIQVTPDEGATSYPVLHPLGARPEEWSVTDGVPPGARADEVFVVSKEPSALRRVDVAVGGPAAAGAADPPPVVFRGSLVPEPGRG
ncbi:hypothetical protein FHX74_003656 [Friedmanniella endophytica]|uniref:DUF4352 domain-containing protein n=1 Tax=Microlunatus kandeliicorticis TaxID=1759536 RepID=A0A7W3IVS4_9ACTN|nr:hypothetical protein [Microlunatus kandeliicorticis]MBA8796015.1 hypothetical protein [Microlunatus kandeliicorticis]